MEEQPGETKRHLGGSIRGTRDTEPRRGLRRAAHWSTSGHMLVKRKMLHPDPCGLKGGTRAREQEVPDRDKVRLILRMRSVIVRAPWPGVSCLERKEFPVAGSDGAEGEPLLVGKLQRGSGV